MRRLMRGSATERFGPRRRAARGSWKAVAAGLLAAGWLLGAASKGGDAPLPTFDDVAPRSKITYISNNDLTGRKYFPQPMCGGVAIFDYDNDGRLDIYLTNGAKFPALKKVDRSFWNVLLRNKGNFVFEDVTEKAGLTGVGYGFTFGVAAGDYDNDGDTDLFLANAGKNALFRNNGDGTFTDVTDVSGAGTKPKDLLSVDGAWFDHDNDGLLDLVVSNYTFWSPYSDVQCTMDTSTELYCHPSTYESVAHQLFRNLGNGKFQDVTEEAGFAEALGKGMGIAIADFDGNGTQDVFVANDTEPNFLYINHGDGTFEEVGLLYGVAYNDEGVVVSSMGCDAKDFDNDGWVDIFYNDLPHQIFALFRNEGGEYFEYVSPTHNISVISRRFGGWSAGFIDFDNDGWKDIYSANGDVDYVYDGSAQHDTMFRNLEGKRFEDVSVRLGEDFLRVGYQRGSAFADFNDDGWMDLVVTSLNDKPRILINSGVPGRNWLLLDLRGRKSNRDAIGAKVKVTLGSGRVLYNHVTGSVGFMSTSDTRVHFGLGEESKIRSVEIQWPSGTLQNLGKVKPNRVIRVTEPK